MADAKQCDRCSMLYSLKDKEYMTERDMIRDRNKYRVCNLDSKYWWPIDLCNDCLSAFNEFMNGKED